MPGGLLNIVAYGNQNIILNGNPSKTFYKCVYAKYTNFGLQKFRIDYSGSISVPSQEIDIRVKPSWTYAGATHRTDSEGAEENTIHPHAHFHSAVRARNLAVTETGTNAPQVQGPLGRRNASTIPIQDWLLGTTNSSGVPGSGQQPCFAIDKWSPGSGGGATGGALLSVVIVN